jgi:hypothetical protein
MSQRRHELHKAITLIRAKVFDPGNSVMDVRCGLIDSVGSLR